MSVLARHRLSTVGMLLFAALQSVQAELPAAEPDIAAPAGWLENQSIVSSLLADWPKPEMSPFEIDATLIVDGSRSLRGGLTTNRGAVRNLFELAITAPSEPLFGYSGGTFGLAFQNQAGRNGSDLVGDLQGFSNIDADGRTQIAELWYEHVFDDAPWRVRIGKVDANTQFAFVEHGLEFLQSSMGVSPTIFVMPTYPDPSFGANIFYEPAEGFYAGLGLYDGAGVLGIPTGSRGVNSLMRGSEFFLISEAGWRWNLGSRLSDDSPALPGRIGVGGWFHDGTFARFDGGSQSGTGGAYVVFDQLVFRETDAPVDSQGLGVFAQYGYASQDVSAIEHHFGTGLTWTGPLPGRDQDSAGVGISWAELTSHPTAGFTESHELTTELFYSLRLTENVTTVFDLQHITNPGGQAGMRDATVGTVRFVVTY